MKKIVFLLILINWFTVLGQNNKQTPGKIYLEKLIKKNQLTVVNREVKVGKEKGIEYIEFLLHTDEGLAWIDGIDFKTGIIELDLKGQDVYQHSFLGIAFHGRNDSTFEAIYFRPFQFRTPDTIRQKRAVQYINLPVNTWAKLRETQPGKFENSVVPAPDPNGWFHAKFIITETEARVYVNKRTDPCLTVPLLGDKSGKIGLYTADRSGGSFANLRVIKDHRPDLKPLSNVAPRHLEEIAFDTHRRKLMLYGGSATALDGTVTYPDHMAEWNNREWKENPDPGPENRYGHALVYQQDEKSTYLLGGIIQADRKPALDVWKYDGTQWTRIVSDCPAKTGEATYDPMGKRILFYGDVTNKTALRQNYDPLNFELWELKNKSWKKLSDQGPSISSQFELAYDSRRNALIIPTWENSSPVVWEWQNEKWHKVMDTGRGPSDRNRFALEYDGSRQVALLFGGRNENSLFLDDFWQWDGHQWTEIVCEAKPPGRAAATMEYGLGGCYLYGGVVEWGLSNEIWKWQGNKWKLINGALAFTEKRTYEEYHKMLIADPDDTGVLLRLGQLNLGKKRYEEAYRLVKKAYALKPEDHNILVVLNSVLTAQNKENEMEILLKEAVSLGKLSNNSWVWLANKYYITKNYRLAILCYQASVALQPDGGSYYNLACCQALFKDIDSAFANLDRAVEFGFSNKIQYQGDADLEALKSDERWEKILKKLK